MTTTIDIAKLQTSAGQLRAAMMKALEDMDDGTTRKLANELAAVNKNILDIEATSQGDARTAYMNSMHDALGLFEYSGLELTVKYDAEGGVNIIYRPTNDTIEFIKSAIGAIPRPSSATRWAYEWVDGQNGQRGQQFEFAKRASTPASTNGGTTPSTKGWLTPDGNEITLSDAFKSCATPAELAQLTGLASSAAYTLKVKVAKAAGYKKS